MSRCLHLGRVSKEDGLTGGTKYEIQHAKRLGKEVILHWEGGKVRKVPTQTSFFAPTEAAFSSGWMKFFTEALV